MQDIVKTRSCQIQLDELGKPVLYADGETPQKPTFEVFAGLPPAELSFEAQSPLFFVSPFILWQDDASPVRTPIDEPPSISHSLSDSNQTLMITVTPQAPPEALTYHFTMHLSDGSKNHEVGPGANEPLPGAGVGAQYGADPTIVENPPIG
ncbi:MAG TPA: hypothetical protein VKK31_16525 [Thermoanaerobaculia bacterium]|nr:hypothetical protein [Thermoanaerobaculia bacterium]